MYRASAAIFDSLTLNTPYPASQANWCALFRVPIATNLFWLRVRPPPRSEPVESAPVRERDRPRHWWWGSFHAFHELCRRDRRTDRREFRVWSAVGGLSYWRSDEGRCFRRSETRFLTPLSGLAFDSMLTEGLRPGLTFVAASRLCDSQVLGPRHDVMAVTQSV